MTDTALMVFMLVSQILLAVYLLYSFNDVERESAARSDSVKAHMDRQIAELEKRLASGMPRSVEELDRVIRASASSYDADVPVVAPSFGTALKT